MHKFQKLELQVKIEGENIKDLQPKDYESHDFWFKVEYMNNIRIPLPLTFNINS